MDDRLKTLREDIDRVGSLPTADRARCLKRAPWLAEAPPLEQRDFLHSLLSRDVPLDEPADELLRAVLARFAEQRRKGPPATAELRESAVALYRHLGPPSRARGQILVWLGVGGTEPDLRGLADLLVDDPPASEEDAFQALTPLFQNRAIPAGALFPRLLDALSHPSLAAAVLDLANYLTRQQLVAVHPAAEIRGRMVEILGQLVGSLGKLTEQGPREEHSMAEVGQQVGRSVSLAVSLCDALALIGDKEGVGKLYQAMELGHRRLRTEAAAALARLGEERGREELLTLATEPVVRLRVLAYAQELGLMDKMEPEYRTPQARAEAELTVWLAEPTQFGLPPSHLEIFDQRRQFWPGFAEPVDCFLFRFTYELTLDDAPRMYSNIGIAGPLAHAFTADLADLSPDDIYAAYAGWHAQHEEIKEFDVPRLSKSEQMEVVRLERRLHDAGYREIQPLQMGYFFGEKALTAQASREAVPGIAVADFSDVAFFPIRNPKKALGPREAYSIYKGRKLLKTFNRE